MSQELEANSYGGRKPMPIRSNKPITAEAMQQRSTEAHNPSDNLSL